MIVKDYIIASAFNYGIVPYVELFAIMGPLRSKLYGEGLGRRIYFPKDALRKLGITPPNLWTFIQLPLLSPVEVSEFNRAAQDYQEKYGTASLKKAGREQGRFFLRKRLIRGIFPGDPFRAHRFLMNCFSLSMGARDDMNNFEIGKYTQSRYLERHFPFELVNGKILPGEKYFWTFLQGALSTDLCHRKQMRAEVIRKNKMVHILSKSVDEWGDYLLDNIDEMF
ncbi:MAG: hypothetical protein A2026_10105 [Deltaproteobacteria bacterium RBG_19FT_COMBO_46_12]|nr:MAG: hypothetical protein A2026_10105 [Deltaproteobacteria bacterium RBG_19FT_COMBO_46_12]